MLDDIDKIELKRKDINQVARRQQRVSKSKGQQGTTPNALAAFKENSFFRQLNDSTPQSLNNNSIIHNRSIATPGNPHTSERRAQRVQLDPKAQGSSKQRRKLLASANKSGDRSV
jgi:hypothetical protein